MNENLKSTTNATVLNREPEPIAVDRLELPALSAATDAEILAYLRHSTQIGEIATQAEQQALIRAASDRLQITISDEEWQAAGDAFRLEQQLFGTTETLAWLAKQRLSADEWSEGIRINLLTQKLKETLFGAVVDSVYISDRENYRRVALSQILVTDLSLALHLTQALRENPAAFCQLALEHSKGKQSQEQGGFAGTRFVVELLPEIRQAIDTAQAGEVTEPVKTKLGYHILKIEKWYPAQLSELVREQVINALFQNWLLQSLHASYAPLALATTA